MPGLLILGEPSKVQRQLMTRTWLLKNRRPNKKVQSSVLFLPFFFFFFFLRGKPVLDYPVHFQRTSSVLNLPVILLAFQHVTIQHFMPISNETLFSLQYFGVRASTGLLIVGLLLLQINQSQKELFCINYWFCLQLSQ